MGGSGGTSIGSTAMQALPVGMPKVHRVHHGLGRRRPIRRRQGHHDDVLRRRRVRAQPPVPPHLRQRRRRHRRHGRADDAEGRGEAADRRHDVRRHDAVRRPGPGAIRGGRLRDARLPRGRKRRPLLRGADHGRRLRRSRGRNDNGVVRRAGRRRPVGRTGAPGCRRARRASRRSSRSARSTW